MRVEFRENLLGGDVAILFRDKHLKVFIPPNALTKCLWDIVLDKADLWL